MRLFRGNRLNVAVLSDVAKGDFGKVERLRKSDVLKAGQFYTVADFLDRQEADIEDVFEPALFAALLNIAYSPPSTHEVTVDKLVAADATTTRLLKKAEALFKRMPDGVAEFDHYAAAEALMKNPELLREQSPAVAATLDRAERIFKTYNGLLPKS